MNYLEGDKDLIAKLQSLSKKNASAAIRKGSRAGCKVLAQTAKDLSPSRTGALRQSIKVRSMPRSRKWTGTMVRRQIFYGAFLEFGTKHIQARHYMEQAVKAVGSQAQQTALDIIKDEVERRMT